MPTLSGLAGVRAVADTCAAETGSATCAVLAEASGTDDPEGAISEQFPLIAKL